MAITCLFCEKEVTDNKPSFPATRTLYMCKRCGLVQLTEEAVDDFPAERFSSDDKAAISITLRNEWEQKGKQLQQTRKLTLDDIKRIISQFRHLDPIQKMDYALCHIDKSTTYVGMKLNIEIECDYPLYYCKGMAELWAVLILLIEEELIASRNPTHPYNDCVITAKGYQRLRDIQKPNRNSTQCFVAMWFTADMDVVFSKAIKPAIEFIEVGERTPRYQAVKIDNVEHINDINDEIIAQIRRSRFKEK